MFRNKTATTKDFGLVPRSDVPRSSLRMQSGLKTAFNASDLVPMFCRPVTPGDTIKLNGTFFARLATPLFPFMDNLHLDTFYFFVPHRLVWDNFVKFMGEQEDPGDSISYTFPTTTAVRPAVGGIYDFFGLPTEGQIVAPNVITPMALPFRGYNLIWNQWFRDQNLQNSVPVPKDDGPDGSTGYTLLKRNKRHDYFTSMLPAPQKGNTAVNTPLSGTAPILGLGVPFPATSTAGPTNVQETVGGSQAYANYYDVAGNIIIEANGVNGNPQIFADLSAATSATINQLRTAITLQQFLEKDARGGTRYTEIILSHFNVHSPDARLQRTEYLGGGSQPIQVRPVEQTSSSDATSPQGNLAAFAEVVANHGFHQSFTEHGFIIGLMNVRADLTYQQGTDRFWNYSTRYDLPWPVFANLGEQAILSREIYTDGTSSDLDVIGYQERYAEERYIPSKVTGLMRSTAANTIDVWHLAQDFATRPTLNSTFITENVPLERVLAVEEEAAGQQIILDGLFTIQKATCLPMYGVPGLFRF